MKNGVQEPSFGPFQLYKGGGLGNDFMKKTGLDPALAENGPAGVDFALDHAKKNGWGAWYGADKAGISNWQGIGTGGGTGAAADAVGKLANASTQASTSLTGFGNGIGQVASSFAGKAGNVGGAAGGFDWSSLTSSSFKTNTTYGDFIGATGGQQSSGGGLFGLLGGLVKGFGSLFHFADGTESAPGGLAIVGERGRELVNLPRGSQVIPNHRTESALAANGNSKSGFSARQSRPQVNVTIMGNAYGDDHLQTAINNGVQQGFQAQEINNRRGNTGAQYDRWNKDKG